MNRQVSLVVILFLSTALLAGKFWDEKSYLEWSEKEATQLLADSPWVHVQKFSGTDYSLQESQKSGGAPRAVPTSRLPGSASGRASGERAKTYEFRLQSATPIRMALARLFMLRGGWDEQRAEEFVANESAKNAIIVIVRVRPDSQRAELDAATLDEMKETTSLVLKKSKRRVPLADYISPAEAGDGWAYFFFPRQLEGKPAVTLEEGQIRFVSKIGKKTNLRRDFSLKKMVFQGALAI